MISGSDAAIPETGGKNKTSCWKPETVKKMQSSTCDRVCCANTKTKWNSLWLVLLRHQGETGSEVKEAQSFLLIVFLQTKYISYQ